MKRVFLFVVTNLAVLLVASVVLGIVVRLLGVDPAAVGAGQYTSLLIFAAIFGMGGAFVSLLMSKWSAKRMMGAHVITQPQSDAEQWLVATVQRHAQAAGIGMPEVAVFDSPQPNAFATGARRDKALVAVSTGLLRGMNRNEVDAVLGHEISHVANGDMVTLALIQGVVNTFVIFLSRVVGEIIDRAVFRNEREGRGIGYFMTVMVLQVAFGVLASMVVFWFSRRREFRADAGGARLAGRENMISALERLKGAREDAMPEQLKAFGITGGRALARLFMTHPPLDERIAALRAFQG